MPHTLPPLPYAYDALEPYIDAKTMEVHYSKHHQAYIDNLNKVLTGTEWADKSIEKLLMDLNSLPENIRTGVRNNGGGHYNHSLFWKLMKPAGKVTSDKWQVASERKPNGKLGEAIKETFGSWEVFKEKFTQAGLGRFGSGWAWLVKDKNRELSIMSTANQDSPVSEGFKVVLGVDVWEHAYYLKYQNKRADYLKAWWEIINVSEMMRRWEE